MKMHNSVRNYLEASLALNYVVDFLSMPNFGKHKVLGDIPEKQNQ
jgi:hypothetical protein